MASGNNYSTESDEKKKDIGLRKKSISEASSSDDNSDEDLGEMNIQVHQPQKFLTFMWNWAAAVLTLMSMMVVSHQSTAVQDEDRLDEIHTQGDHEEDSLLNQSATQPEILVETATASSLECGGTSQGCPTENITTTSSILKTKSNLGTTNIVSIDSGKMEQSKNEIKTCSHSLVTNNPVQPNERNSSLVPIHDKVYDLDRPPDDEDLLRTLVVGVDNGQVPEEQPLERDVKENSQISNSSTKPATSVRVKTKATDCRGKRSDIELPTTSDFTARDEETSVENVKLQIKKSKRKECKRAPIQSPTIDGQSNQQQGIVDQLGKNPLSSTENTELACPDDYEGREMPRTNTTIVQEKTLTTQTPEFRASDTSEDLLTTHFAYKLPEKRNGNPNEKIVSLLVDQTQGQGKSTGQNVADKNCNVRCTLVNQVIVESGAEDNIEATSDDEHFPAHANEDCNTILETNFGREIDHGSAISATPGEITSSVIIKDEPAFTSAASKQEKMESILVDQIQEQELSRGNSVDTYSSMGTTLSVEQVPQTNQVSNVSGREVNNSPLVLVESDDEGLFETSSNDENLAHANESNNKPQAAETGYVSAIAQQPDRSVDTILDNELASIPAAFIQTEKQGTYTGTDTNPSSSTTSYNHQAVNQVPQKHEENTVLNRGLNNNNFLPNRNNEKTRADACLTSELIPETNTQVPQCTDTNNISDGEPSASKHDELAFPPKVSTFENTSMHQHTTESNTVDRMQGQDASETDSLKANESVTCGAQYTEKQMRQENPVGNATISNKNNKVIKEGQYLQENSTTCDDTPRAQTAQAALPPRQVEIALMTSDVNSERTEEQHFNERNLQLILEGSLDLANIQESNEQLEGAIKEEEYINKRAIDNKAKTRRTNLDDQN